MADGERLGASFSIDITNLQAGLQQANRLIRESNSEFKAAASGLDDWTSSEEGLTAKLNNLTDVAEIQRKKVNALQAEYDKCIQNGLDPMSAAAVRLRTDINNETASLNSTEAQIKETEEALDNLGNTTEETGEKSSKFGEVASAAFKVVAAAAVAAGAAIVGIAKEAIENFAEYEQLVGGVETLFKESSDTVVQYAANAYKTAGLSANEYMETVTGFSASLLQSLGGDTEAAAKVADMAITDMADNANKMGSSIEGIQNAYGGFAKANYTMLDNLKLGYGGTKEEMERLLEDATKLSGVEYDLSSYADIVEAIHVVQTELGITGTTAKEASTTIQGSVSSMQSAWANLLTGMADETQDFDMLLTNFIDSVLTVADNLIPRIKIVVEGVIKLVEGLLPEIPGLINQLLPSVMEGIDSILSGIVSVLPELIKNILGYVPQLVDVIISITGEIINALSELLPDVITLIVELVPEIVEALIDALPVLQEAAMTLLMSIVEVLPDVITSLVDALPELIDSIVDMLIDAIPIIFDAALKISNSILEALPEILDALAQALPEIIDTVIAGLIEGIPLVIEGAITLFNAIIEALPEIIKALDEALPDIIDSIVDGLLDGLPLILQGAIDLLMAIIDALPVIIDLLVVEIPNIIHTIVSTLLDHLPELIDGAFQLLMGIIDAIPMIITELIKEIPTILKAIASGLLGGGEFLFDAIGGLWDGLKGTASAAWDGIKNAFSGVGEFFSETFKTAGKNANKVLSSLGGYAASAWQGVKDAFSTVGTFFKDTFSKAWQKVKDVFSPIGEVFVNIKDGIVDAFKVVVNALIKGINKVIALPFKGLNGLLDKIQKISIAGLKPFDWVTWRANIPEIPELAKGGVVKDATHAVVGEDGAEAIVPLERNTEWIDKVAEKLASKQQAINVYQTNNYSQAHSRYEIYKSKQQTAAAVRLALLEG